MGMSEDRNINEEYGLLDPGTAQNGRNLTCLLRNKLLFATILCSSLLAYCCICCSIAVTR
jgi:hypothetical protein